MSAAEKLAEMEALDQALYTSLGAMIRRRAELAVEMRRLRSSLTYEDALAYAEIVKVTA